MKKLLKTLFYLLIGLILLSLTAIFLATHFLNPNDYKDKISTIVHEKTGRELVIQGTIELSFFPWIGVRVHDVQLANAVGFEPPYFASVGEADVRIKLLPLFSDQLEVGKITLKDLTLNLAKNKAGVSNWQDLRAVAPTPAASATGTAADSQSQPTHLALSVAGVDIYNAHIIWMDAQKNQTLELKNLQLTCANPVAKQFFPCSLSMDIHSSQPALVGQVNFDSQLFYDLDKASYRLKNLQLAFTPAAKVPPLSLRVEQIAVDLSAQTLMVAQAVIAQGDLNAQLSLQGRQILDKPIFNGRLQAAPFNLKNNLKMFGKNVITADPAALQQVALDTVFTGSTTAVNFQPFSLHLDNSTLQGSLAITDFASRRLRFNLAMDQLNVDSYLPPKVAVATPVHADTGVAVAGSSDASFAALRQMDIQGNLQIGQLTAAQTVLSNVVAQILLSHGQLQLNPLSAAIYKGSTRGKIAIDLRGSVPKYTIDEALTNIDMSELVKSGRFTGKANLTTQINLQGQDKAALLQSLTGNLQLKVQNGALLGTNIPYQVERAVAVVKRQPLPAEPVQNQTNFDLLTATGTFKQGLFSNNDLLMQSAQFKATGKGTANLVTEALDYHLQVVGVHTVLDAQGIATQQERQTPIPVVISGTFAKPVVLPDLKAFLQSQAGKKVAEQLQEKVQNKLGPDAGRAVGGLLQQLLKQ